MGLLFWATASVAAPKVAAPKDTAALVGCPYSSEEVSAALGMGMKWQPATVMDEAGMKVATCRGIAQGANGYMFITQSAAPAATAAKRFDALMRTELKGAEPVEGDPDGARWWARPDLKSYTLVYVRGTVMTRLNISSPDPDYIGRLREGLLKLRRLP